MKKLLAILLAMMLPLGAMADANGFSIAVDAPETAFLQFAKAVLMLDPAMDANTAAQDAALIQKLLDGMALDMVVQDDAFTMELRVGEQMLIDLTAYDDGQSTYLTSSMLPGYALKTAEEATAADTAALDQIDWTGAVLSAYPAVDKWLSGLEMKQARGVFVGDAYEGGVKCTTWTITDVDFAALMDVALTEDVRKAAETALDAAGMEGSEILRQLEDMNTKLAAENVGSCVLRVVQDAQDQLVGLSLTLLQNNEQVGTASLGVMEDGLRLVIGLGLSQENYWGEFTVKSVAEDGALVLHGASREWGGSKDAAFSIVCAENEPAFAYEWRCRIDETDEETFSGEIEVGTKDAAALKIAISAGSADEIAPIDATAEICDTDDPMDRELYEKLLKQVIATLTARLIKLLPLQMILEMTPFALP